jgi:hypothetical protein
MGDLSFVRPPSLYSYPIFSHLGYSSAMKMKAAGSSETLVTIYRSIRRHMSEDSNFHLFLLL